MANTSIQTEQGAENIIPELELIYPMVRSFLVTIQTSVIKNIFYKEMFGIGIKILDKIFQYTPPTVTTPTVNAK